MEATHGTLAGAVGHTALRVRSDALGPERAALGRMRPDGQGRRVSPPGCGITSRRRPLAGALDRTPERSPRWPSSSTTAPARPIQEISDEQLRQLQDALEEEFEEDRDYYLTADTLDFLAARGVDSDVLAGLRAALGAREGFDVVWRAN